MEGPNFQHFKLCEISNCSMETTYGKWSNDLYPWTANSKFALVVESGQYGQLSRHERCHHIHIEFDENGAGMKFHAAALANAGKLFSLYEKQGGDNGWVKIKTNV